MLNHASDPDLPAAAPAAASRSIGSGWLGSPGVVVAWLCALALVGALAVGEVLGWPFLARPLERVASAWLQRAVQVDTGDAAGDMSTAAFARPAAALPARFGLRLFGALRIEAPRVRVAAPVWSHSTQLLVAHDVAIELRYIDLWRAWRGQPLRIERLHVDTFELHLDRLADGRASWRIDPAASAASGATPQPLNDLPFFGHLQVASGNVSLHDEVQALDLQAQLSLLDAASPLGSAWDTTRVRTTGQAWSADQVSPIEPGAVTPAKVVDLLIDKVVDKVIDQAVAKAVGPVASSPGTTARERTSSRPDRVLQLSATGRFRQLPLRLELLLGGSLPVPGNPGLPRPLVVNLSGTVGTASLAFDGRLADARNVDQLAGRFRLRGPSLAAVGDPLGVTLPSTGAFSTEGEVTRQDRHWKVVVTDGRIGASRLAGTFDYAPGELVPLLRGRLVGARLHLADLGPAVGTTALLSRSRVGRLPAYEMATAVLAAGRVLPARDFDLAALRAMNADVAVSIAEVDLGSGLLEPLRPLRVRLLLQGGVLTLRQIDARLGAGRLSGELQLDGRRPIAVLSTRLRWDDVALDHWIHQKRRTGTEPYVSGRLSGSASLTGQGGSTARILASLNGSARTELQGGSVSHLAVELAGLDLAASLGLLITGDDRLRVSCAVADLVAVDGVFRPRRMVLDTSASAIWVGGSLSLASETLDLRAVVSPRGFSPVSLRTPLTVRGSFANPQVTFDRGGISRKLGTAALLAIVNPLAALLPLVELASATTDGSARRADGKGCAGLVAPAALRQLHPPG